MKIKRGCGHTQNIIDEYKEIDTLPPPHCHPQCFIINVIRTIALFHDVYAVCDRVRLNA